MANSSERPFEIGPRWIELYRRREMKRNGGRGAPIRVGSPPNRDQIFRAIAGKLAEVSLLGAKIQISDDTELYRDLRIYGDDFFFDVLLWVHWEFGITYVPDIWGPSEGMLLTPILLRKFFRLPEKYRPSPKVGHMVDQIHRKLAVDG